jgi:hypothetical protein
LFQSLSPQSNRNIHIQLTVVFEIKQNVIHNWDPNMYTAPVLNRPDDDHLITSKRVALIIINKLLCSGRYYFNSNIKIYRDRAV